MQILQISCSLCVTDAIEVHALHVLVLQMQCVSFVVGGDRQVPCSVRQESGTDWLNNFSSQSLCSHHLIFLS